MHWQVEYKRRNSRRVAKVGILESEKKLASAVPSAQRKFACTSKGGPLARPRCGVAGYWRGEEGDWRRLGECTGARAKALLRGVAESELVRSVHRKEKVLFSESEGGARYI